MNADPVSKFSDNSYMFPVCMNICRQANLFKVDSTKTCGENCTSCNFCFLPWMSRIATSSTAYYVQQKPNREVSCKSLNRDDAGNVRMLNSFAFFVGCGGELLNRTINFPIEFVAPGGGRHCWVFIK